jgi:hypothetical protein
VASVKQYKATMRLRKHDLDDSSMSHSVQQSHQGFQALGPENPGGGGGGAQCSAVQGRAAKMGLSAEPDIKDHSG